MACLGAQTINPHTTAGRQGAEARLIPSLWHIALHPAVSSLRAMSYHVHVPPQAVNPIEVKDCTFLIFVPLEPSIAPDTWAALNAELLNECVE